MRTSTLTVFCSLLAMTLACGSALSQESEVSASYQLGPGDWIVIDVFGEDDLSMDVMLDDTGIINYPFLGSLNVQGMTVGDLEQTLVAGLKGPYLVDPDITVAVKQYRSIYVNGEVGRPGSFPYEPGMTVEKAIALAGGFTERAARNKIQLKRSGDPEGAIQIAKMADSVRPGDIITIAQSFF